MKENNDKYIYISNQADLDFLIKRIDEGPLFAEGFKFTKRSHLRTLFKLLHINYKEFIKTYYYYDKNRNLHISESEFGYVWISTYGLIARDKTTSNNLVNACVNQHTVLTLLLDKAIEVCKSENVYDVDGYNFGLLNQLSPALFHNLLFYVEVFCKAYLSLSGIKSPNTHKLSIVYSKLIETMFIKKHNDSLFQAKIADQFSRIVGHVNNIPGNFKEQFVKYDDNPDDTTVILFQPEYLTEIKMMVELCHDFILDYFYSGNKTHYLKSGLYQRILDMAETEDQKKNIRDMYGHFISKDEN
jgi:hypothetical protein